MKANARLTRPTDGMNRLEARYAEMLEAARLEGTVHVWQYEPLKFRLAKRTWYTPDFLVIQCGGDVFLVEVKGFQRDDARVKIKTAAELYPWFFWQQVTRKKGIWQIETF